MEIIPIIIIIIIITAVRSAIEASKKKQSQRQRRQQDQGQQDQGELSKSRDTDGEEKRFPEFRDSEEQSETERKKAFIDEKVEKYRTKQKEETHKKEKKDSPVRRVSAYAPKDDDFVREMTSTRKELKKGIIWKEILDKPKFNQRNF